MAPKVTNISKQCLTLPLPWKVRRERTEKIVREVVKTHVKSSGLPYRFVNVKMVWAVSPRNMSYKYRVLLDLGARFNPDTKGDAVKKQCKVAFPQANVSLCSSSDTDSHWALQLDFTFR